MSSTRRASEGAPISYERYMSSPEYAELRGIPGTAVAAKAQLYLSARKRSLLFFLQSMSLKDGGLRQLARELFKEFPERIGSATMHAKSAKSYDYPTAVKIADELGIDHWDIWLCDDESAEEWDTPVFVDGELIDPSKPKRFSSDYKRALRSRVDAEVFLKNCRDRDEHLSRFLVDVCINPRLPIRFSTDQEWLAELEAERASEKCTNFEAIEPRSASVHYFKGIMDALAEFQDRYAARVRSEFVMTTIATAAFETLDHALSIRKMTIIEGLSGSGKTTAAEAWCAAHQGQTRFVTLSGITHKTGFFQKLAAAIGLASSNRKATDMQVKVEDFFRRTRLMLVIDEAHYLFPQHQRSNSNPELVDWVNTALVNQGVPVALICTDQFVKLKSRIEKRTGWTSEQLEHRVKRYVKLPEIPTKEDLQAVASKLLSLEWDSVQEAWTIPAKTAPHPDLVKMVLGYALTSKPPQLPTVKNFVDEGRIQARINGRSAVSETDLKDGMMQYQIPSDQAMKHAFPPDKLEGKSVSGASVRPPVQRRRNEDASPLQAPFTAAGSSRAGNSVTSSDPHEPAALNSNSH